MGLPNLPVKSTAVTTVPPATVSSALSKDSFYNLIVDGDLAALSPEQRVQYLTRVTESMGLNPMTRPFGLIRLDGKVTLYALKEASTQLAKRDAVSVRLGEFQYIKERSILMVMVTASTPDGRTTDDIASVPMGEKLTGEAAANAYMKLATKAKRRAILTHCGLGIIDESEFDTIRNVQVIDDQPLQITKKTEVKHVQVETVTESPVEAEEVAEEPTKGASESSVFNYADNNDRQWLIDAVKERFPKIKRADALSICATFNAANDKFDVLTCLDKRLEIEKNNQKQGKPSLLA
jgi:hypothetical protein